MAICPVSIKKYLKSKLPYLNNSIGTIQLMFDILPDGKIRWSGSGFDLDLPRAKVAKMSKDIEQTILKMPLWKFPEGNDNPIMASISIKFD